MAVFFPSFVVFLLLMTAAQWLQVDGAVESLSPAEKTALESFFNATQYSNYNESNPCSSTPGPHNVTVGVVCANEAITELLLSKQLLKGYIPVGSIGNLTSLKALDLSFNQLSGHLPGDIGNLKALTILNLAFNNFSGSIPGDIGTLPSLQELNFSANNFSSQFSPSVVSNVSHTLQKIDLTGNSMWGTFPDLSQLWNLKVVRLARNLLTGRLPRGFPPTLEELDLFSNRLIGSFPSQLLNLTNITYLRLGSNSLSGEIGALPASSRLKFLDLSNNSLSGRIPELSQQLEELRLYENRIWGGFPSNFNSSNLTVFDLHDNRLSGPIPALIPESLELLDVHGNNVSGNITEFVNSLKPAGRYRLSVLDFSANNFRAQAFPMDISHLTNLTKLHLANLAFHSHQFPILKAKSIQELNFSRTKLSGNIPDWFITSLNATSMVRLDLSGNELSGTIPSSISRLKSLQFLDLSYNNLTGEISPEFVALTALNQFNVSYNNLSGPIPDEEQFRSNNSYFGNPALCGFPHSSCTSNSTPPSTPTNNSKSRGPMIAGLVAGIVVILVAGAALLVWCRASRVMKRSAKDEPKHVSGPMQFEKDAETWATGVKDSNGITVVMFEKPLLALSFADLLQATGNFSKEMQVADGGYGPVYRGVLPDSTQLAIKVLAEAAGVAAAAADDKNISSRIEALAKIRHANLVPLIGYCLVGEDSVLIYEYMMNGDLQRWLHELPEGTRNPEDWSRDTWECLEGGTEVGFNNGESLSWPTRHRIALGTARGLAFLHHGCSPHVIHRDVKSSNVLLDENFEPRLVDSGLAGIARTSGTPIIGGTLGYVPPEYGQTWQATTRGDVYSFGVVLLELVTGRQPTGHYFPDSCGGNLVGWVRSMIKLDKRGQKALDPNLLSRGYVPEMLEALRIGYLCTAETPAKRPTMQQVVGLLKDCQPGHMS